MCCGANWGRLWASDLLSELSGYSEDDEMVSFLQNGTLSWIGYLTCMLEDISPNISLNMNIEHIWHYSFLHHVCVGTIVNCCYLIM